MLITFSSLVPRYRIERFLDPTTSYLCLSNKPKQPCPPHPSKPLFGHVPFLLNHCLGRVRQSSSFQLPGNPRRSSAEQTNSRKPDPRSWPIFLHKTRSASFANPRSGDSR